LFCLFLWSISNSFTLFLIIVSLFVPSSTHLLVLLMQQKHVWPLFSLFLLKLTPVLIPWFISCLCPLFACLPLILLMHSTLFYSLTCTLRLDNVCYYLTWVAAHELCQTRCSFTSKHKHFMQKKDNAIRFECATPSCLWTRFSVHDSANLLCSFLL